MGSSILRILAGLLALGAILVGYLGYQASHQPPEKPTPVKAEKKAPEVVPVVIAARGISAGRAIVEEDLKIEKLSSKPDGGYSEVAPLLGHAPAVDIPEGASVLSNHFPTYSRLAKALEAGERAVAVKVNEVTGVGGFVQPGDRVDVLFYLRGNNETGRNSSAQVVLSDVRVLAFGNMLVSDKQAETDTNSKNGWVDKAKRTDEKKPSGKKSRTAVLAVPESAAAKLLLAESAGNLRLALKGVHATRPPGRTASQKHFLVLKQLVGQQSEPTTSSRASGRKARQVKIYCGDKVTYGRCP
ncbi:MAG: hypothetical protein Kow0060_00800 [Methylohalobius crimeensis]